MKIALFLIPLLMLLMLVTHQNVKYDYMISPSGAGNGPPGHQMDILNGQHLQLC